MTPEDPNPPSAPASPAAPAAAPARRSRGRRIARAAAWTLGILLALVLVLGAGSWWWLGTNQSLAFALNQAANYLPAGQTLQSRDVKGSLRAGGRIGYLRYESPGLAVEVKNADIGWLLKPLLSRKVELGKVNASDVLIERRGPVEDKPTQPLEQLALPVDIELPFHIDRLRWAGPPVLEATQLEGHYRYADTHHQLEVRGVDIADGHYSARVRLQGPAPMALDASLDGRVKAPLAEGRSIDVIADATAKGTLAGEAARLQIAAHLKPAEENVDAPMRAQLQAHIAPWLAQPVIDAKADLQNVDLASLVPTAPATRLSGEVLAGPGAAGSGITWQASADIRNALPGPWDTGKLPVQQVEARAQFDGGTWTIPEATVRAGGGRIDAAGAWRATPAPWKIDATVRDVRPGELHTQLAGAAVSGTVTAEQRDAALRFNVALQAARGGAGSPALPGIQLERALAKGQWKDEVLDLDTLRVDAAQVRIDGTLQLRVAEQAGSGKLSAVLPGATAQVQGRIAPTQGAGEVRATVADAAALQRWVEKLPGLARVFEGTTAQGNAQLDARWQGGWKAVQQRLQNTGQPAPRGVNEPTVKATLSAPRLDLQFPPSASGAAATPIGLRGLRAELDGSLAQANLTLQGEATLGTQKLTIDTRASGGLERANQWRAAIASLSVQAQDSTRPGPWTLTLADPLTATVRSGKAQLDVDTSAGSASLQGPVPGTVRLSWQPIQLRQAGSGATAGLRLQSKGSLKGLPMAWAQALSGNTTLSDAGITGDLLFDGEWDIDAGDTLHASARLARQSGDIRVQAGEAALVTRIHSTGTGTASEMKLETATGNAATGPATPAGLRQAELRIDANGDAVRANLVWDSERAGDIRASIDTRLQQRDGAWQWAEDAPLNGRISARLPSLGVWSMLAPPGWRIAGTLNADATLSGNRAAPRWNGTLGADQLALRALVEGLDLRDGRLRATLSGDRVEITEFTLKGGTGSTARIAGQSGNRSTVSSEAARDGGSLSVTGNLSWGAASAGASGIRMALQGQLRALRLLVRSDRQVTISGNLTARLEAGQITVRGDLKTDRAVIILPDETAPSLGSDVVVRSAAKDKEIAAAAQREAARTNEQVMKPETAKAPDIAVKFDLGDDFAVQGRGITTRLEGVLDIRTAALNAPPRITGEVRTVKGQYRAYGQQLDVETGIARFNGPYDNPSLDILAIRPNISQRAGVQVTGTAQAPRVKLYSDPTLSDAETLSWVVLGRASATSGGESQLLQQAALAVLGGLGKGGSGGSLASRFGLDEVGFKGPGSGGDVRESAVTLGKRLANDFYVTYERSLSGTFGTLFIFYDLTQRLTLRGQAGQQSGVDLIYTVKYD
ncbi:translocation/assembly module TamB domain-containing protein [Variovorax ginsengisoli]|uniref:Translocation and assembly module TamB n=1 Tax=Variovorax ginsengisoli TaxID=363844 RepID=A0ABT9S371_9BURK|nr:translocation/assembly module TamB domain-containing protein [Variovorax ginsengisoli]MDP9898369.1 translocation and assembly module TamB [Variovorax ginsengisoli]